MHFLFFTFYFDLFSTSAIRTLLHGEEKQTKNQLWETNQWTGPKKNITIHFKCHVYSHGYQVMSFSPDYFQIFRAPFKGCAHSLILDVYYVLLIENETSMVGTGIDSGHMV